MKDFLTPILERTRAENARRRRHAALFAPRERSPRPDRGEAALRALRRASGSPPRVMAELKFRSPSAGQIAKWAPGEGVRIARAYERGGAAVVSVLADGPGFGGSVLQVRRVASAVSLPVLFKGFVLDPVQVELAFDVGASLVLLLVRALEASELRELVSAIHELGMQPVVEAANRDEVKRALDTGASIVGVNARNLQTFQVDMDAAALCMEEIPSDRVAVFMSGVRSAADFQNVARGRADAVLIGEGLMRCPDPAKRLAEFLRAQ